MSTDGVDIEVVDVVFESNKWRLLWVLLREDNFDDEDEVGVWRLSKLGYYGVTIGE